MACSVKCGCSWPLPGLMHTSSIDERTDWHGGLVFCNDLPSLVSSDSLEPLWQDAPLVEKKTDYPHGIKLAFVVVALILSIVLVALDMTIVTNAIPSITDEFHSLDQVGWYGSAFFLTLASFQSTWGKLYKYFPPKTVFLASVSVFETGSLVSGVARSSTTLVAGRAITGCGAAGIVSGCYIIIAFIAPPERRPAFTGILGAAFGCASVAGALLGGVFTDDLSWRWCFFINLPIGGFSLGIILLYFKTPSAAQPKAATLREKFLNLDIVGTCTIMAALICVLLATQWGGVTKAWKSADVIGVLVGFVFLTVLFIVVEIWQGERALIIPRLIKQRIIAACCLYITFQSAGNFLFTYYLLIYFQAIQNTSAVESGLRNLPFIAGASITAISSGIIIMYIEYFTPLIATGSSLFAIGGGLIYSLDMNSSAVACGLYQLMLGIGQGLAIQVPVIVCQAFSDPADIPAVTSMVLFFQIMGGAIFVSVGESILSNRILHALAINVPELDPVEVLNAGASGLHSHFPATVLPGVIESYMTGIKGVFALGVALAVVAVVTSFGPPIRNIKEQGFKDVVGNV